MFDEIIVVLNIYYLSLNFKGYTSVKIFRAPTFYS
jgi:hypothetical protein